ncbi:MAG TPA: PDGLE domain-containing protein [Methanomicrobiales archaeon]|nr:PDGLE domain-containing protein [Methanomicrobiales archaeon]
MVNAKGGGPMGTRKFIVVGIIIALIIGVAAVFLASSDPDGLESTALIIQGQKTLTGSTPENAEIQEDLNGKFSYSSPMPDYSLGESMGPLGGIVAIVVGTLLSFVLVFGLSKVVAHFRSRGKARPNQ